MFCKKCGYELGSGDVFCPKCGTKTSVPPQPAPAPQYTQPASVPPAPQPGPVMNAQPVSPAPAPQPQPAVQPQSSAGMPQAASSLALDIETICRKTGIDQTLWLIILGCSALILLLAKSAPLILAFGPFALGVGVICYLDNARKKAGPVNPQIPSYSGQPTPSPYAQPAQPAPHQTSAASSLLNANTALFDTEEIFYLKPDWDKVYHAIMTANYQGSITSMNKQDGAHAVNFESPYFTARFSEKQNEGPLHCYKFRYTGEKNMNSLTAAGNALSNLVTAIETTLSSLDPTATVIRQNR